MASKRIFKLTSPVHPNQVPIKRISISPHDTVSLSYQCRAVYVGVTGNVAIVDDDGTFTYIAVPAGSKITGPINMVLNTGTTADRMIGEV